jgi:hypothetical protein
MTDTQDQPRKGWVEAAARILKVTLGSPRAKSGLNTVISYLDPDSTPELVDAALRTDPELPLALLSALPEGLNILIETGRELARELAARPTALVRELLDDLVRRIRFRSLGEAAGIAAAAVVALQRETRQEAPSAVAELLEGLASGLRRRGLEPTEALATLVLAGGEIVLQGLEHQLQLDPDTPRAAGELGDQLRALLARHPEVVRQVLAPVARPLLDAAGSGPASGGP